MMELGATICLRQEPALRAPARSSASRRRPAGQSRGLSPARGPADRAAGRDPGLVRAGRRSSAPPRRCRARRLAGQHELPIAEQGRPRPRWPFAALLTHGPAQAGHHALSDRRIGSTSPRGAPRQSRRRACRLGAPAPFSDHRGGRRSWPGGSQRSRSTICVESAENSSEGAEMETSAPQHGLPGRTLAKKKITHLHAKLTGATRRSRAHKKRI